MTDRVPNQALRSWLDLLGWSPERLARMLTAFARAEGVEVTVSAKAPYHWLNGVRPRSPTPGLVAALLTEATGEDITPSDLEWGLPERTAWMLADQGLDDLWTPMKGLHVLDHAVRSDQARQCKRPYEVVSGMSLVAAHHWLLNVEGPMAAGAGRTLDASVVDELERIVDARRRLDDLLGGGALYPLVHGELRFVVDLIRQGASPEATGRRIYGVAAELARLAGWACIDNNEYGRAQRYLLLALRAAHLSGDRALGAHVLGFMAEQALASRRPQDAVTLLNSAYAGAGATMSATEKAVLHSRLARAHGWAGQAALADAAADTAFELLDRSDSAKDPVWTYWCDWAAVSCLIGDGYAGLGDTGKAVQHLDLAIAGLDPRYARSRAVYMLSLAGAHLTAGRQDQAVQIARDAVARLSGIDSARALRSAAFFRRTLAVGAGCRLLADFDAYLESALGTRHYQLLGMC